MTTEETIKEIEYMKRRTIDFFEVEMGVFNIAIEALKTQESIEPLTDEERKGKWIPCSEKMPPCGETVLVTVKADDQTWTYCDTWYQGDWMAYMGQDREVIAWMPLPEPYKEVDT